MRWTRTVKISVLAACALIGILGAGPASANSNEEVGSDEIGRILVQELQRHPGGIIVGNEIHYADGDVFVAVEMGVYSLSQCGSGKFCGWALSNYTGSFYSTSGSGVTKNLSWNARSYSNNRSQGARLYNSSGSASVCFSPGQDRPTIASAYYNPSKVKLSSTSSC